MKKIALINQRYGLEVNGGSEYYTRLIAEHLNGKYDVEVLTTRAVDYVTWENYYVPGIEIINGVKVHRFHIEKEREKSVFDEITKEVLDDDKRDKQLEMRWVKEQGPYCPALIQYLEEHSGEYEVFIFVTYLYYLTAIGLPLVADKSILIPTAHDEPFLKFSIYKHVFEMPKAFIFLTEEEQQLVYDKFSVRKKFCRQAAVGIDVPTKTSRKSFCEKYQVDSPFMLYVGRIDEGKNCHWMFRYFLEYKARHPESGLKLILMGKAVIPVPEHQDIVSLGFVSEEDKYNGISACEFLILPSEFESLSISVLEAMKLGKPVLVNGKSAVLRGHCRRSNAGFYYDNYFEFEAEIDYLMQQKKEYEIMKKNAKKYVQENYTWDIVVSKIDEAIEFVADGEKE